MATEFQMHPAGIINGNTQPGISTAIIPRLTSQQAKSVGKNRAIPIIHYTGPKKVMPTAVPTRNITGISYTEVCARQASLLAAQEKDMQWLNSLSQGQEAMECNGFNSQLSRNQGIRKPASAYMFGFLIDAPPFDPDTILTTLTYIQKSLVDMRMTHVHLSIDMQLFVVTTLVCWYKPMQFHNVITHPGGIHILQSFIGCITELIKNSRKNWLMLFDASAATKNTLHAHLNVTAVEKTTASIRIQEDKVHWLELRRMLKKRMLKRPLRWCILILKKPRWTMKNILWRRF